MARLMEILDRFLDHLRKENPYDMVLKGGTALAVHHLLGHRESEDLDFDVPEVYRGKHEAVISHILSIFTAMEAEGVITGHLISKRGFVSTDRYHVKVTLRTHRDYHTKIDIDYVAMPAVLERDGRLLFYTAERMFVVKLLTFADRGAVKDLYDISHLVRKLPASDIHEPDRVAELISTVVEAIDPGGLVKEYKRAFSNVDMRFRDLKERDAGAFVKRTVRDLNRFRNELRKR
jgi:predicted nucleotidyltransferase component of viral defense system